MYHWGEGGGEVGPFAQNFSVGKEFEMLVGGGGGWRASFCISDNFSSYSCLYILYHTPHLPLILEEAGYMLSGRDILSIYSVVGSTRETIEGWLVPTVETEANGGLMAFI
jgi:hypothetical protein